MRLCKIMAGEGLWNNTPKKKDGVSSVFLFRVLNGFLIP